VQGVDTLFNARGDAYDGCGCEGPAMNVDAVARWQELSALYEEADELDAHALPAWLAALRARSHPLLGELERMLSARDQARDQHFLDAGPGLADASSAAAPNAEITAHQMIGPWRLVQPLGAGGMAEVWLAERADGAYQRRVAMKLLHHHVASLQREGFVARFARERDILAALHHPHIAALFDAGVTPQGQPWLALEYVQGLPITEACDSAQMPLRERVRLFGQVLQAVQHAHSRLVVHRDLKPANILVNSEGSVRLLDFGIAKLAAAEGALLADTELTRLDGRPLTPLYASPEQLRGEPLTTSSDVYSLGVVLYELLCGERPYELALNSSAQLEQAVLVAEPRAPSRRALREDAAHARASSVAGLRKTLAPDLDAVVLKALAKSAAQRYASVDALQAELQRWLDGEAVQARLPSAWVHAHKFIGRHRLGVALGSAAGVGLVGLAITATVLGLQARQESARALASRDFLIDMFRRADPEKAKGASITAGEMLESGRRDVMERLAAQPDLQIDLLKGIARVQHDMGDWSKAAASYAQLAQLMLTAGRVREASSAQLNRAECLLFTGAHAKAEDVLRGLRASNQDFERDVAMRAQVHEIEGWIASARDDWSLAQASFETALRLHVQRVGENSAKAMQVRRSLAMLATDRKDHAAAIAWHDEIARRLPATLGLDDHERTSILQERLDAYYGAGQYASAYRRSADTLAQCIALVGANAESCRLTLRIRALAALRLGWAKALSAAEMDQLRAMADDKESVQNSLIAQHILLRLLIERGAATHDVTTRRERLRQLLADDSSGALPARVLWRARWALAESYLRSAEPALALALCEAAIADAALARDARDLWAWFGVVRASALAQLGRTDAAQRIYEEAAPALAESMSAKHPLALLLGLNGAVVFAISGQSQKALTLLERSLPILLEAMGADAPVYLEAMALQRRLASQQPGPTRLGTANEARGRPLALFL
jgi:eukaryotic-like serine/threonine-protein kinase